MCTSAKGLLAILLAALAFIPSVLASPTPEPLNSLGSISKQQDDTDDDPDITDRVARVSIVDGEAKIRRVGSDEWEKVTNNLPLVEGDEIATNAGGRLEIQFAKNQHLRLDENSYLRISGLKDEGIALSLSLGSLSVRLGDFDRSRSFFEIDAPKATIAIEKPGRYRIDAGRQGDTEIRASVSEEGEARVYTENAGFTLRNNRSARIFIDGNRVGEWEAQDPDNVRDDFAFFVAERERFVEQQLKDAYFGKYYDDDIYGAEELDEHGEWLNTPEYGYVWRPSRLATSQYSDWSPYRYGHWRYMSPYGWVWVNDEPWGWATYHYGRWIYHRGYWVWAPYGYYRSRRSWWWPAYVSINIVNDNVCWYPLGYHRRRYRFNDNHQSSRRKKPSDVVPVRNMPPRTNTKNVRGLTEVVPPGGVVAIDKKDFGMGPRGVKTAPPAVVRTVLSQIDDDGTGKVALPNRNGRKLGALSADGPRIDPRALETRTGAAPRTTDRPMDDDLRKTRMFGGRPPRVSQDPAANPGQPARSDEPRKTGILDREPSTRTGEPVRVRPEPGRVDPVRPDPEPVREKPRRSESQIRETPTYTPPQPERKKESREIRETPRYEPPPRQPDRPREDPPQKSTPRIDSQPKSEPKSEPKNADKPAPAPPSRKDKPDNR